jgi:hypothetical protein
MRFSPNDVLAVVAILAVAIVISVWVAARHLSASRQARALSDMAITTQEHVDLRLTDLGVQAESLRDQLEQMQRILKEVE